MIKSSHVFWAAIVVAIGTAIYAGVAEAGPAFIGGFLGSWVTFTIWAKFNNWSAESLAMRDAEPD